MSKRNRSRKYKKESGISSDLEKTAAFTDPDDSLPETIDEQTEDFSFSTEDDLKEPWERDEEAVSGSEANEGFSDSGEDADSEDPGEFEASADSDRYTDSDTSAQSKWTEDQEESSASPEEIEAPAWTEEAKAAGGSGEPEDTTGFDTTGEMEDAAGPETPVETEDAENSVTAREAQDAEDSATAGETQDAEDPEAFEEEPERDHWWRRLGRKFTFLVYGLAVLLIVVGGFSFYYMHSRQEPVDTVKKFLGSIQILDFDTMTNLLQDQDLSNLNGADIMNPSYQDFFREINARMAYSIRKVQYSMRKGTAKVTAHIRYIDGTEIYTSVVSEFLREIVSSAFSGNMLTEDETTQKLVQMLEATTANLPETYAETEIAYPVVKTEYGWKIAVLDEQTVKVMSANFKNIEEEISRAMAQPQPQEEAAVETREEPSEEEDLPVIVEDNDIVSMQTQDVIHLEDDDYTIVFDHFDVAKDYAGNDCLLYYYTYTNNRSEQPSSALLDVSLKAFQEGKTLTSAIPNNADAALDNYYEQAGAGESLLICQAFLLADRSNVSIQAAEASYDSTDVVSQVLRIQ